MPIDLTCPSCQTTLQVPDHAAGKKARCPSCGEVIPVPDTFAGVNPYETSFAQPEIAGRPVEEITGPVGTIDIGQVWNAAWSAWKDQLGILIGAWLIATIIPLIVNYTLQFVGVMALGFAGGMGVGGPRGAGGDVFEFGMIALNIGVSVVGWLVGSFLTIGQIRILLDVSRGVPTNMGRLFSGADCWISMYVFGLGFGLVVMIGYIFCIIPGLFLITMLWPGFFLIADGRAGIGDAFSKAAAVTQGNRLNSFVLMLLAFLVALVGYVMCCVGIFATAPLASMLMAVAYRTIAGDPAGTQPSAHAAPIAGQNDSPFAS